MAKLRVKIRLSIDGRPLAGFPLILEQTVAGPIQQSLYNLEAAETFADMPIPDVSTIRAFAALPLSRGPMSARFGGQSSGGVQVNRLGGIIGFNTNMSQKPKLQNDEADYATSVIATAAQAEAVE